MNDRSGPFEAFEDSVFAPLPHATARAVQVHASMAIAAIRTLRGRIGLWIRTGGVYRQGGRRSQGGGHRWWGGCRRSEGWISLVAVGKEFAGVEDVVRVEGGHAG